METGTWDPRGYGGYGRDKKALDFKLHYEAGYQAGSALSESRL